MRTVIQGKEITVTLKTAGRDLSTQEIVMGHQLATGNFEALFVNDDSDDLNRSDQEPEPLANETKNSSDSGSKPAWIEKGETVSVEITCPFCGFYGKAHTRWGNSFSKCKHCQEKLHNKFATGVAGEKNSWGCVYTASEPMIFKNEGNPFEEIFEEPDSKSAEISE
ncbi:hypothetical protein ACLI5Y_00445 [Enterococcus innesii]|uniref:hypothetical protein n=1 Tax=Enterococcus TaxID=1350 RepID=UPI000C78FE29|nr:hypothetical protein [Enterococcus sp. CR-Ec1]AUJ85454.1 hypothetical protein CXM95_08345 [Enterococcus sp. CR-Ec1]